MAPKMCGTFEMGKCVGMGATASVYIAYEPNMRKDVAIKVLKHSQNSVKSIKHEVKNPTYPQGVPERGIASPCLCVWKGHLLSARARTCHCVQHLDLDPEGRTNSMNHAHTTDQHDGRIGA